MWYMYIIRPYSDNVLYCLCTTFLFWTSDHSTRWGRVCDTGEVTPICTTALATPATVHLDPYTKEGAESLHILVASKGKNVHTVNLKCSACQQSKPWKSAYLTVKLLETVKALTCSCSCHQIESLWKWPNYVYDLAWKCLGCWSAVMSVDEMSVSIATIKSLYLIATVQYLKGNMNALINQERTARGIIQWVTPATMYQ